MATATVEQLPGGRVRIDEAVIAYKSSDGLLVCGNHPGQQFCNHIEACISLHADAGMLTSPEVEKTGIKIKVPIAPRQDQWAWVKFGEFHEATHAYKLYLEVAGTKRDERFIGFLQAGEGRAVIRSMIYDWFRTHVETDGLTCYATSHKFKEEAIWKEHIRAGGALALAEHWSVFTTKMCLPCNLRVSSFDDLVPDAGGNRGWRDTITLDMNTLSKIMDTPAWQSR